MWNTCTGPYGSTRNGANVSRKYAMLHISLNMLLGVRYVFCEDNSLGG
ncbi:hypothetical protein GCM10007140_36430 [Priestia taiwanensis]|uniref:Uncharacterized protein n=1 Tax=Priestia taiwanensis TaxID=1347902 RepID=A0A917AYY6_9BACI|nr:hypothetical protein GCM10007140_36430 [Priestia taiwanensis]